MARPSPMDNITESGFLRCTKCHHLRFIAEFYCYGERWKQFMYNGEPKWFGKPKQPCTECRREHQRLVHTNEGLTTDRAHCPTCTCALPVSVVQMQLLEIEAARAKRESDERAYKESRDWELTDEQIAFLSGKGPDPHDS